MSNWKLLPYGAYLCRDSIVWFDRRYRPIVRVAGDKVTPCDPHEWIEHSGKEWLYSDRNQPRRDAATRQRIQNHLDAVPEMAAEVARRTIQSCMDSKVSI